MYAGERKKLARRTRVVFKVFSRFGSPVPPSLKCNYRALYYAHQLSLEEEERYNDKILEWNVLMAIQHNIESADAMLKKIKSALDGVTIEPEVKNPMEFYITDDIFGRFVTIAPPDVLKADAERARQAYSQQEVAMTNGRK